MYCDLITIGDELLIGQVIDTNSSWIAQQLNLTGVHVRRRIAVADDESEIIQVMEESLKKVQILILTGGLGPTKDDITKATLSKFFNSPLVINKEAQENLNEFYKSRNRVIPEMSKGQYSVPEACKALLNKWGTAPGMWFDVVEQNQQDHKKMIISLPGVPTEMKGMMETYVIPELKKLNAGNSIFHKTILTHGVGETFLAQKVEDWENKLPSHIKLAYLPAFGNVRLRLSSSGADASLVKKDVLIELKKLESLIAEHIFGYDDDSIESIVHRLLSQKKKTLCTAESCTAGSIASSMVSIPGSSVFFKGSIIAYANEIKSSLLNVHPEIINKYGAVSEAVVISMAENARKVFDSDYSVATTGIAGPDGATDTKAVGLVWIAISSASETISAKFQFNKNRSINIQLFTDSALQLLRKQLLKDA